ncbi:SMC-Scp complex subunit ScpB [Corynebacterium pelargi]|uniref:Segregation and condensation protein B n=1 Tax=Corynebacterium pelargi TaxID=1471400 RepID=A0A410W924_9CORY|nr:SMC-Scp complex subunit ScpB [Corynebacterium pelargi]QAU52449.1 Segregation and condensation protein B [Corynebacterium pelargi]GGG67588.1 segregation and condensation protein B [Corynebacterium pelargi]
MISQLRSAIESVLLVADEPVQEDVLARVTQASEDEVRAICREFQQELLQRGSGMSLKNIDGGWRLYTHIDNAEVVERFLHDGTQSKLSRAALETLAVIAYRQPATRAQVAAVRGVNVDGVVRTLVLRGLIREIEAGEGSQAHRYETTELFLELMGIESLDALPDLAPLLPDVDSIDEEF